MKKYGEIIFWSIAILSGCRELYLEGGEEGIYFLLILVSFLLPIYLLVRNNKKNEIKNSKFDKKYILIAVYIVLVIIILFYFQFKKYGLF